MSKSGKYGPGSVALSNVNTRDDFAKDWQNMSSQNIKEVDLNYHGNNQTLILNSSEREYVTSTGNGRTNKSSAPAKNVQDLPTPKGNIANAQLNLNSCKSNSKTQYPLKGSHLTLMEAFYKEFDFRTVRGASVGVSYNRIGHSPEPQWFWQEWEYLGVQPPKPNKDCTTAIYYHCGGHF